MTSVQRSVINMYTALRVLKWNKRTLAKDEYLDKKVTSFPGWILVRSWREEKNPANKYEFEYLLAKKLNSLNPVLEFNPVPDIYLGFLDEVSSIDAIVELLKNSNRRVKDIATRKYVEFFNSYLDYEDRTRIVDFQKEKERIEKGKVIKLGEWRE